MNSVSVKKPLRTAVKIALPESELPALVSAKQRFRSGIVSSFGERNNIARTPVRQMTQRDLDVYMDPATRTDFVKLYGAVDSVDVLGLVLAIALEIRRGRFDDAQIALKAFVSKWGGDPKEMDPTIGAAEHLNCIFNAEISAGSPIVWQPDGSPQFAFGLYCEDAGTALFLLALQRVGAGRIGRCQGCGEVMIADRTSKRFHDAKCRVRAFMRKRAEEKRRKR
jgi:hypothetical protein